MKSSTLSGSDPAARARIGSWLREYARLSVWLAPLLLLLRAYEFGLLAWRDASIPLDAALVLRSLGQDLLVAGVWIVLGALLYAPARLAGRRVAAWLVIGFNGLLITACVGLIEYFLIARVPLGADLFGYSGADIAATIRTSTDFAPRAWLPFVAAPLLYLLLLRIGRGWRWPAAALWGYGLAVVVLALLFKPLYPQHHVLTGERIPALTANKLAAFTLDSLAYAGEQALPADAAGAAAPVAEYPLLRAADAPDVLGPLLRQAGAPPNIVIIGVEGYGRDFTPGQRYGGFTPVLGRLMREGLYFPNFVALSGRSFGFLPSIIGSLPPGEHGFMDLGPAMPVHDTLISLLNDNGYHTAYFAGFSGNFDNIDVFLERQAIDFMLDESKFGPGYEKMDTIEGGFTWGYADQDLYRRAFEHLAEMPPDQPRLDIYHTLNLHEPFIIPRPDRWRRAAMERLAGLDLPEAVAAEVRSHPEVFAALLYSDDALGSLIERYRARPDFERTIFVITGDHRLIPIPEADRIDRFSVPLILWSPLLKQSARIEAVSTHLDVVPSLVAYLRANYGLEFPQQAHWLGEGIDVHPAFRSRRSAMLMRTKNSLTDYLAREYLLSGNELFRLRPGMDLEPVDDPDLRADIAAEFARRKAANRYVIRNNKLRPGAGAVPDPAVAEERALLEQLQLTGQGAEALFNAAREAAFAQRYEEARLIGTHVLREHPNYHDMRMLVGRTYAWEGMHDEARRYFRDVMRRNSLYADAYSALADVELWSGRTEQALQMVEQGLAQVPDSAALWLQKARILHRLQRPQAALQAVDVALRADPGNEAARELQARLAAAARE